MNNAKHWNEVYTTKPADRVGWYKPHLDTSLDWMRALALDPGAPIIDVGGGASTLVDDLLQAGHRDVTVLDISGRALGLAQARLESRAERVTWLQADITSAKLPAGKYRLWHDRAVFHFLLEPEERQKYREALLRALRPDGFVIIGAFSPDAPPQCSGLPVQRYGDEALSGFFGPEFEPVRHRYEPHFTPSGLEQSYVYCLYRRTDRLR